MISDVSLALILWFSPAVLKLGVAAHIFECYNPSIQRAETAPG